MNRTFFKHQKLRRLVTIPHCAEYIVAALIIITALFTINLSSAYAVENEITYTGANTHITGDDSHAGGNKGPFDLGFTFDFYGSEYTNAYFNINGTLNFGAVSTAYSNNLVSNSGPDNTIFVFWDDLITDPSPYDATPIYYATVGSAPNRKFIGQWTNMYFYGTSIQMGTFQVILYEGSNEIQLQYRDLLGGSRAQGDSATIGIRKNSASYEQYSFNTASLTQGQAIHYTPNGENDYTVNTNASYDPVYLLPEGAPISPTLVNPTNETVGITTTPTFEWLPVNGATSYTVLVSTVSDFSSTVVNESGITDTSYTLQSTLNTSTKYYWRVQSVNEFGSSLSPTRTFTTGSANEDPNIPSSVTSEDLTSGKSLSDLNGSTITMNLTDSDDNEQVRYRIQIASDDAFNNLQIDYRAPFGSEGGATYTYGENSGTYLVGNSSTELSAGNYYLRIRAEDDAAGSSDWYTIEGIAFTIAADETAPDITNISDSPTNNSVTITWTTSESSSSQVEYGLVPTYGQETVEADNSPTVTNHTITISELKSCARYFYRVKSSDASDNQSISSQKTFTTTGCDVSTITVGTEESIPNTGGNIELTNNNSTVTLTIPDNYNNEGAKFQINVLDDEETPQPPTNTNLVDGNFFDLIAVTDSGTQLTTFNEPVVFTLTYDENTESSFIESTLGVYKYNNGTWENKNCALDTAANTLTCSLPGFSVYGVFGQTASIYNSSSDSSSSPASASCTLQDPTSSLNLFQIDSHGSSATLFFTPASGEVTGYIVEYGTTPDSNQFAVAFNHSDKSGAVPYTISGLTQDATWYFRVKAQNGCRSGDWSNTKSIYIGTITRSDSVATPTPNQKLLTKKNSDKSITPTTKPKKSPTPKPTEENAELYNVTIRVQQDGKPVGGIEVEMHSTPKKAKTDKNGIAIFKDVEGGLHKLKIVNQAYASEEEIMVDGADKEFDVSINLNTNSGLLPTWAWVTITGVLLFLIFILLKRRKPARLRV